MGWAHFAQTNAFHASSWCAGSSLHSHNATHTHPSMAWAAPQVGVGDRRGTEQCKEASWGLIREGGRVHPQSPRPHHLCRHKLCARSLCSSHADLPLSHLQAFPQAAPGTEPGSERPSEAEGPSHLVSRPGFSWEYLYWKAFQEYCSLAFHSQSWWTARGAQSTQHTSCSFLSLATSNPLPQVFA